MGMNQEASCPAPVGVKGAEEEEYMSPSELISELHGVAKHYGSVAAMCKESVSMKADDASDPDVIKLLDAAIALQLYAQLKKKQANPANPANPEAIDAMKKVFTDNITDLSN